MKINFDKIMRYYVSILTLLSFQFLPNSFTKYILVINDFNLEKYSRDINDSTERSHETKRTVPHQ